MSRSSLSGPALVAAAVVVAAFLYWHMSAPPPAPDTAPAPVKPVLPKPIAPKKPNCPHCSGTSVLSTVADPCPNPCINECTCGYGCGCLAQAPAAPVIGGKNSPDGSVEIVIHVDSIDWPKNIASKGLGCCGFRSIDYCARVQAVPALVNLPEKMKEAGIAGGDYPTKQAEMMAKFAPGVEWWQDTSKDIRLIEASIKSQRPCACDYNGHDPHYHGSIAHCVTVVACDVKADWIAILDNNYPSLEEIVWMHVDAFKQRWQGWAYGLLAVTPGQLPEWAGSNHVHPRDPEAQGQIFGLIREGHPWGDDASLNGSPATVDAILAAIGGEMGPLAKPKIEVDHRMDLENLKMPGMIAALAAFAVWVISDKKGRQ